VGCHTVLQLVVAIDPKLLYSSWNLEANSDVISQAMESLLHLVDKGKVVPVLQLSTTP
jgi:hypothetical protein